MRYLLLTSASAVLLTGCIVVDLGDGHAAVGKQNVVGGDLQLTLDEDADFRIAGADLMLRGRVDGELSLAGADIVARDLDLGALDADAADLDFEGEVAGDVSVNTANLVWNGDVGGAFSANMANGEIEGALHGAQLNAADLHLDAEADFYGPVRVNAVDLRFDAHAHEGLDAAVRSARLNGAVSGRVAIYAEPGSEPYRADDGLVEINGVIEGGFICARRVVITGEVDGPLEVVADAAPILEGGSAQNIIFNYRDGAQCRREQG